MTDMVRTYKVGNWWGVWLISRLAENVVGRLGAAIVDARHILVALRHKTTVRGSCEVLGASWRVEQVFGTSYRTPVPLQSCQRATWGSPAEGW